MVHQNQGKKELGQRNLTKLDEKERDRPHDVLIADQRHNTDIALTLAQARNGAVVCVRMCMCMSMSVPTGTDDGVRHEIDSLLARVHAS